VPKNYITVLFEIRLFVLGLYWAYVYGVKFQAASMKMAVFWDVVACSLVEVYRRFRGACYLSLQGVQTTRRNIPEDSNLHLYVYVAYFAGHRSRRYERSRN
jgi:hypothetical protein